MSLASQYTQGMGGLKFVATAPPGQGRLIRIPFYLETNQGAADFQVLEAGSGILNNSTTSPIIACGVAAAGQGGTVILKTPQISWATLRLVGFEADLNFPSNPGGAVSSANDRAQEAHVNNNTVQILFRDLMIGGGATLFVHEDFGNASTYASSNDSFAGLRDYPLIKSPNVAQVTCSAFQATAGAQPAVGNNYTDMSCQMVFSCSLVCEILQDDQYGVHTPGPYARSHS